MPIILGQRLIWKNRKGRRRAVTVQDKFYYVSLIDSLKVSIASSCFKLIMSCM